MPLYEYLCTDCGASTDVFATVAEKSAGLDVACRHCDSRALRRTLSTVAIRGRSSASVLAGAADAGTGDGCCGGGCGH